jgi:mono/diheme cytochrome c family protein
LLLGAALLATACNLRPGARRLSPAGSALPPLTYTAVQTDRGRQVYLDHCVLCHGINLSDAQFGAPLKGAYFQSRWHGRSAAELFLVTQATMPPEKPMSLSVQNYADVIAYVLQENNVAAGEYDLPAEADILLKMPLPW